MRDEMRVVEDIRSDKLGWFSCSDTPTGAVHCGYHHDDIVSNNNTPTIVHLTEVYDK